MHQFLKQLDVSSTAVRKVGLNGLMWSTLEDAALTAEYERGHFDLARNFLASLHCGLGIDTYPIGIDESPARVVDVLRCMQSVARVVCLIGVTLSSRSSVQFSHRYHKSLAIRFVSDGGARVGQRTRFANVYLRDVVVRPL